MVMISVASFVVLGLTESGLGTAWPSMRRSVGRPVEDLGTLLVVGLLGYASSSALSGRVVIRFGTGRSLIIAGMLSLSGLAAYGTAGSWSRVLAAALLLGLGSGVLDSTLNAHGAHHFSAGAMNLLHAGFGVGATIGPLVMAGAVAGGAGWQAGYLVYAAVQTSMLVVLIVVRRRWLVTAVDDAEQPSRPRRMDTVAIATLAMFFLYTGIEVAAGQWSFSVLTEDRGLTTGAGGAWVAAYWGGLMVGRFILSGVADWLGPVMVLRMSMAGAVGASIWFWWDPSGFGVAGLPTLGLSLAGIFPTLVSLTPQRLGADRTTTMVGYQLAAASLGAAAVPWTAGRVIAASSLAAVGPFLAVAAVVMAILNGLLERTAASTRHH
jgi:fucose permease